MGKSAFDKKDAEQKLLETYSLAEQADFHVHPNPFVGAIIYKNNVKISEGFHQKSGEKHAEVIAIEKAGENARGADIFVSLEPCSTKGKTPPCTDLIIKSGIKKVFFGAYDSDPRNKGRAVSILADAGVEVCYLDCEQRNLELNRSFIFRQKYHQTYYILKTAISLDGCIADSHGNSRWISCEESRNKVHLLRKKADAVLIGANTFNIDNPSLNIRVKDEPVNEADRIILSRSGTLNTDNFLLHEQTIGKVLIITSQEGEGKLKDRIKNNNVIIKAICDSVEDYSLKACLTCINEMDYYNILVEGGSLILGEFIRNNCFNELHLFVAPTVFGAKGLNFASGDVFSAGEDRRLELYKSEIVNNDVYLRYLNVYRNY